MAVSLQKAGLVFVAVAVAVVGCSALVSAAPLPVYGAPYFFPGHCASPDGGSTAGLVNGTLLQVFQILPGATGTICVNYTFYGQGYYVFPLGLGFPEPSGTWSYCGSGTGASNPCGGIEFTRSPPAVEAYNGETVTVGYTVQASPGAREGAYMLYLGQAQEVTLVIGPLNQSLPYPPLRCCAVVFPVNVTIAGVTGVNVVLVNDR